MTLRQALRHWDIPSAKKIQQLHSGLLNETYRVATPKGNFILQKLSTVFTRTNATKNYAAVTDFLRDHRYPAPEIIISKENTISVRDKNRTWRLMKEIPGRVYGTAPSSAFAFEAGKGLGTLHSSLKDFHGPLTNAHPMFRYAAVLKKLRSHRNTFENDKNPDVREAGRFLMEQLPKYFLPASLAKRAIHTDPKISNFIFNRSGRVVSMIDFDTTQRLSPLYDLGDALRSLCGGKEDDTAAKFDRKRSEAFLRGYFNASKGYLSAREKKLIPQASALVILGLASRFLNDYIEDYYFGWNPKRYKSRKENNLARTLGQISLYKSFISSSSIK